MDTRLLAWNRSPLEVAHRLVSFVVAPFEVKTPRWCWVILIRLSVWFQLQHTFTLALQTT